MTEVIVDGFPAPRGSFRDCESNSLDLSVWAHRRYVEFFKGIASMSFTIKEVISSMIFGALR
jgi:hypothetical protein